MTLLMKSVRSTLLLFSQFERLAISRKAITELFSTFDKRHQRMTRRKDRRDPKTRTFLRTELINDGRGEIKATECSGSEEDPAAF